MQQRNGAPKVSLGYNLSSFRSQNAGCLRHRYSKSRNTLLQLTNSDNGKRFFPSSFAHNCAHIVRVAATLAPTQIAVEEAVLHEEAQGRLNRLRRANGEWRVPRANAPMMVNVGTWGVVESLMSIPRPSFHGVDLVRVAAAHKDERGHGLKKP